jgi:hypothetical protein
MFFPEIVYFLSVFFLRKLQTLSTGKTVLKKRMPNILSLALIFKTLFHPILLCFRFHVFFRQWSFCRSKTNEIFACLLKFLCRHGVGYSVWMFGNVLPVKVCTSMDFPVCAMFPVLLIVFLLDLSAFLKIQI